VTALAFRQKPLQHKTYLIFAIVSAVIGLALWSLLSYGGIIGPVFLPTPTAVVAATIELLKNFNLLGDIGASIVRVMIGFWLAAAIAVPLGIVLAANTTSEGFLEPPLSFIRYIPPSALLPLLLLWFGIGETSKVLLIGIAVLPYIAFMVFDVVRGIQRELIDAAYTLGASTADVIAKVVVPASLPGIWDALRVNIGAAWTFVVLAEIVAATNGLGHLIVTSQRFIQTPNVIAGIIIIGILGFVTDLVFKITARIFFPWTEKSHA